MLPASVGQAESAPAALVLASVFVFRQAPRLVVFAALAADVAVSAVVALLAVVLLLVARLLAGRPAVAAWPELGAALRIAEESSHVEQLLDRIVAASLVLVAV